MDNLHKGQTEQEERNLLLELESECLKISRNGKFGGQML